MKRLVRGYNHSEVARKVYREVCDIRPKALYSDDPKEWIKVWQATRNGIEAIRAEKDYPGKKGDLKELDKWKIEALNHVLSDVDKYIKANMTEAAA